MVINRTDYKSPNYSSRRKTRIDTLVIHHTGGSFPGCAEWLCNPKSSASAHYLITRAGDIYQLVNEDMAAWHAGRSAFDYNNDGSISTMEKWLNRRSIGIELESDGKSYTHKQLSALNELALTIVKKRNIPIWAILGHKEVAPDRKWDPGNFDMNDFRSTIDMLRLTDTLNPMIVHGDSYAYASEENE